MLDDNLVPPYDLLDCSWPRPVQVDAEQRWISPPERDAPLMPFRPQPNCELHDLQLTWVIDWRLLFEQRMQAPVDAPERGIALCADAAARQDTIA